MSDKRGSHDKVGNFCVYLSNNFVKRVCNKYRSCLWIENNKKGDVFNNDIVLKTIII